MNFPEPGTEGSAQVARWVCRAKVTPLSLPGASRSLPCSKVGTASALPVHCGVDHTPAAPRSGNTPVSTGLCSLYLTCSFCAGRTHANRASGLPAPPASSGLRHCCLPGRDTW